jgi:predicted Zn peptidase
MHYEIYKNARDASWRFLIQHNICSLPVDLKSIISVMRITVRKDDSGILRSDERGRTVNESGDLHIIVRDEPVPQKRYTIMHEIGHIVLGHIETDGRSDVDEYAAERFAIGVLAPACVLWGIGIRTADEIAELCNISITSAKIREKRMQELYARNKFLTSPLERQVFEQFSDFINSKRQNQ